MSVHGEQARERARSTNDSFLSVPSTSASERVAFGTTRAHGASKKADVIGGIRGSAAMPVEQEEGKVQASVQPPPLMSNPLKRQRLQAPSADSRAAGQERKETSDVRSIQVRKPLNGCPPSQRL